MKNIEPFFYHTDMFYSTKEFGKSCRGITSSESLGERSLMSKYLACSSMCEIYVIQASQTHLHNVRDVSRVLQQNHFRISNETRPGNRISKRISALQSISQMYKPQYKTYIVTFEWSEEDDKST